ncbi:two-component sensor histidine kinase [Shewanella sp. NFH-SH190041]|uniref:ATP-binding protein n=1 Tax=Shewanella sp. NFH-SH190041 TaxID=2950245 RepID=UPI0021C4A8C6|nr:ATP-binding protein [Shewanella sp. NFH-SH190041]BDM63403.1 two-component sensor histidine kinase [Shewanella sp. NFH-SH190041]
MKRLFISLYLLMSLTILGLGWTLESLWETSFGSHEAENAPLVLMANVISQLPESQRADYINRASQDTHQPMVLLNKQAVALNISSKLTPGHVLTTVGENNNQRQFIAVGNQVLMIGPIHLPALSRWQAVFTFLFYLLLALVILLWIRPLSRDIKQLEKAAAEFGDAKWDTRIRLPQSSQVMSLGRTFNQMAKQISKLIDNQKHLSNAVSHEIRTPLARLKFALALLPSYCKPEKSDEQRALFLADMHEDVSEIDTLLGEMLTYASLESAQTGIVLEQCNLVALSRQIIDRLRPLTELPMMFESPRDDVTIATEPALIERALQNLITNAQRYAASYIRIELQETDEQISLSVIDDGRGIPAEEQEKIFEPYYRSKHNRNEDKGYGLGLAIITRIMDRESGKVILTSHPGYTCFSLCWPKTQS